MFDPHAAIKELAEAEWCNVCLHPEDETIDEIIVPFASLRVSHPVCFPGCLGWVPEPDVEKACWRAEDILIKAGWNIVHDEGCGYGVTNADGRALVLFEFVRAEAILRAALAWIKEQT